MRRTPAFYDAIRRAWTKDRTADLMRADIEGEITMHRTAFIWQQIDAKLPDSPEGLELRAKVRAAYAGRPTTEVIYIALTPVDLRVLQGLGLA